MGFGQKGQPRHTLGLEVVGDQIEQGRASTLRSGGEGVPDESFVVELVSVAVVQLENAVFTHHVGGTGCLGASGEGLSSSPSRVGVETGCLAHQREAKSLRLYWPESTAPASTVIT